MKISKLLKNIILIIGGICLFLVIFLNLFYTSKITNDLTEVIIIKPTGMLTMIIVAMMAVGIYVVSNIFGKINIKKNYIKIIMITLLVVLYMSLQFIWIKYIDLQPLADQKFTYEFAIKMYDSADLAEFDHKYFELYPQQLNLAFIWSRIFRLFNSKSYHIIQLLNVVGNAITLVMILLITKELGTKYKVNSVFSIILYLLFLSISALSTFVYGDEMGLGLALISVHLIMKYRNSQKKIWGICSAVSMALGYLFRMNNLIFIIAIAIYLLLDIIETKAQERNVKNYIKKTCVLILLIAISIAPGYIIKNHFVSKYNLNKNHKFSAIGYVTMGMTQGNRGNGWYNENEAQVSWQQTEVAKTIYKNMLKERVTYLVKNPAYTIEFYIKKLASMWTENTYDALWSNLSFNNAREITDNDIIKDNNLLAKENNIAILQKAMIFNLFICVSIAIIQNRKNIDNDLLLLLLIFVGGFLFHIIWEAKSRYIIPYIVSLMPLASIVIQTKRKEANKNKICKREK